MIGNLTPLQADGAPRRLARSRLPVQPAANATACIRRAGPADYPALARIFRQVVATGDCYVHAADTTDAAIYAYWLGEGVPAYVAVIDGTVVGMYRFVPNQPGRGSHVANASFMVDPGARRKGIGYALGQHCLQEAKRAGFEAMQFNMVVSTNTPGVALWKKLGFSIIGLLPRAFQHEQLGRVDAYVMYRFL